jgi:lipoprotein-anchoring transpeptidase ErfK/SrfK
VGLRRVRRLQRARHFRVGAAVVLTVAVLAGAITIFATTVHRDDAVAGTSAAAPKKKVDRPVKPVVYTTVKTELTKERINPFPKPPANSGEGRRVVYCNSCQRVWLIESDGWVSMSYLVSGRRNYPRNGTYHVQRRVNPGWSKTLRLPYFVGFTYGSTTDVGFHGIPIRPSGSQIQSDSELGLYRSHGCVRQKQSEAKIMWDWAVMGTTVVVTA